MPGVVGVVAVEVAGVGVSNGVVRVARREVGTKDVAESSAITEISEKPSILMMV